MVDFRDDRIANEPIRPRADREREAFEWAVKNGVDTARKLGREVSEDQVRREMKKILEPVDRKVHGGGYDNKQKPSRPQQAEREESPQSDGKPRIQEEHFFFDEEKDMK